MAHSLPMAGFSPLEYPCPNTTSSILSGSTPDLDTASRIIKAPKSSAGMSFRVPPNLPTGVRTGLTMATSLMKYDLRVSVGLVTHILQHPRSLALTVDPSS